jgi:hypothetical protein
MGYTWRETAPSLLRRGAPEGVGEESQADYRVEGRERRTAHAGCDRYPYYSGVGRVEGGERKNIRELKEKLSRAVEELHLESLDKFLQKYPHPPPRRLLLHQLTSLVSSSVFRHQHEHYRHYPP